MQKHKIIGICYLRVILLLYTYFECVTGRDWQKFFDTPTALERKRMNLVRRDFTEGKVKQHVPATITYISTDLPTLPGEAGLR